ncbi:hypothetical protein SE15_11300 [Thermanaerothrix daxensis]|uniref:Uncharacterized protein n=1 Tax=Thermanaerothrix daxensis TaxID=869279 RepID=A0A0P6YC49_9CHLR|nr:hypothetical protein [Thermanaerothrix daxensis]KPL82671.1 hypothetical protein SE15_11300 [Thermanaerothrix daxensis]
MAENWRILIRDTDEQQEITEPVVRLEPSPTGLMAFLQNGETRLLAAQLDGVDFTGRTIWLRPQTQPPHYFLYIPPPQYP